MIASHIAFAQEQSASLLKEDEAVALPEYVTVSTKTPIEINKISPSVSVVSSEQLATEQFQSVADVLRILPGMEVVRIGGMGAQTSVFTRGSESDHTIITMNGRRMPTGFSHQYNLANLGVDNLSSIEVQRGSSSSIWGSDAIGGVIDLKTFTKDQIIENKASAFGEYGSDDTFTTRVNAMGTKDNIFGSIGASYTETNGTRDREDYDNVAVTPYIGYQATDTLLFDIQGTFYRSHAGVPGQEDSLWSPFPAHDTMKTMGFLVSPGVTLTPTDELEVKLIYSHAEDYLDSYASWSDDKYKTRGDEISLQGNYELNKSLLFSLGGGWQNTWNDKESNSVTAYHNSYDDIYLWGQIQWNITEQINVTGSVRQDFYSDFQDPFTASLQASWSSESGNTVVFAKAANGFKVPTPNDYYNNLKPDDLSPEKSKTWEVGIRQFFLEKQLNLGLTYFDGYTKNLIAYYSLPVPPWGYMRNLDKAHRNGVEFSFDYTFMKNSRLYGNYTYLHAKYDDSLSSGRLVRRPMHRFTLGAEANVIAGWTIGSSVSASIDRVDVGDIPIEDYTTVRIYTNYQINDHFNISARVENALDEHYQETIGYTAPHTQFFIGLSLAL